MRRIHHHIRKSVFAVLDIFYPLFRRFMPLQTYHYAACGGGNTLLSLLIYTVTYNFIFKKQVVYLGALAFEPYIAAFLIAFIITFPIGFYLSMYVVFQGSYLRKRIQLLRYFLVAMGCILINYVCLKIFVGVFWLVSYTFANSHHRYCHPFQLFHTASFFVQNGEAGYSPAEGEC